MLEFVLERVLLGSGNSANAEWDPQRVRQRITGDALHHLCLERLDWVFLSGRDPVLYLWALGFFLEAKTDEHSIFSTLFLPPSSWHTAWGQCALSFSVIPSQAGGKATSKALVARTVNADWSTMPELWSETGVLLQLGKTRPTNAFVLLALGSPFWWELLQALRCCETSRWLCLVEILITFCSSSL